MVGEGQHGWFAYYCVVMVTVWGVSACTDDTSLWRCVPMVPAVSALRMVSASDACFYAGTRIQE